MTGPTGHPQHCLSELQPTEIMSDTGAYTDTIFGIFQPKKHGRTHIRQQSQSLANGRLCMKPKAGALHLCVRHGVAQNH
jgi:hypothetical protein